MNATLATAMVSLEQDIAQSMEQAMILAEFLERLSAEQEKRWAWLIRDGEQLRKEREGN